MSTIFNQKYINMNYEKKIEFCKKLFFKNYFGNLMNTVDKILIILKIQKIKSLKFPKLQEDRPNP